MAPLKSSGSGSGSWMSLSLLSSGNERRLDEEDIDFGSDVYALAESSTDELLNQWKARPSTHVDHLLYIYIYVCILHVMREQEIIHLRVMCIYLWFPLKMCKCLWKGKA